MLPNAKINFAILPLGYLFTGLNSLENILNITLQYADEVKVYFQTLLKWGRYRDRQTRNTYS